MAVDPCDEENGCMQVIPNTQNLPKLCLVDADTRKSFTGTTVPLADWMQPESVLMNPGDILFFNGQVIHGSGPNISEDRFRRALIAHYVVGEVEKVSKFYHPLLSFDGQTVDVGDSEAGGVCGVWVSSESGDILEVVDSTDSTM
jgi:ectoine hydroxylase-related dioxygenase (phytanoyl-CoA dioxygenase family)